MEFIGTENQVFGEYQQLFNKLVQYRTKSKGYSTELPSKIIIKLCNEVLNEISKEPIVIQLKTPITIVGDIHGQYYDLLRIFESSGYPNETPYLFLGDYVDRGKNSIEVITLLLLYKLKYPHSIFLLRGNHEDEKICRMYGFFNECSRFKDYQNEIFKSFIQVFDQLPIAAVINNKIFCVHGGLSPDLITIQTIKTIKRPIKIPLQGLLCDLLWSDPHDLPVDGWMKNQRGMSYTFGKNVVESFLKKNNFEVIIRAHQTMNGGYSLSFNKHLVTLFSCPNYMGTTENSGAILYFNSSLQGTFKVFKPISK
ncbi:serine/threonine protein phosphatase PP1-2, putative [Entamoeba dispar SAW760]|uniref:Serine/threonine-protein phosphatase n=1 Tax=Entamoeba dispar (strain ATCC PRA-260 / SAW760) TaxID=370354 RepID=B0EGV2_ENTDS|nr:serine/threonine protein phosphatase PP1-2, putative [Entamoeba dispar SAW760]EDR26242.1 serine/threonine protein phosphatase PP1-2, putative [Entamoeba dispar SAW760]|eukprot:EDR26242.1 serine/threonine protein phosphatase PP1-2, putative [Entamoeba dispar SAW760]